MRFEVFMAFKV